MWTSTTSPSSRKPETAAAPTNFSAGRFCDRGQDRSQGGPIGGGADQPAVHPARPGCDHLQRPEPTGADRQPPRLSELPTGRLHQRHSPAPAAASAALRGRGGRGGPGSPGADRPGRGPTPARGPGGRPGPVRPPGRVRRARLRPRRHAPAQHAALERRTRAREGRRMQARPGDAVVQVRGLVMTYGTHRAVDGIDLEIEPGRDLRPARAERRRQDHDRRDPGGLPAADRGRGPGARPRPRRGRPGLAGPGRRGPAVHRRGRRAHGARAGAPLRRLLPAPEDPEEVIAAVGLTEKAGARAGSLSGGQRRRLDVGLGHRRQPRAALPGRADHRFRPAGPQVVLGACSSRCAPGAPR